MKFYGFKFDDGHDTTTGEGDTFRIAGELFEFDTQAEVDEWVEAAMTKRERAAVDEDDLPSGWREGMAQPEPNFVCASHDWELALLGVDFEDDITKTELEVIEDVTEAAGASGIQVSSKCVEAMVTWLEHRRIEG